ncbi:MAG TPA: hypothetical protein VIS49_15415 [Cyclobacteriaceae bacterium]
MKNKQKAVSKILTVLLILCSAARVGAQSTADIIAQADSLFTRKQYTQSLELYQEILRQRQYSKALLLKMAFIHEGLGHLGESLYYLDLYYLASNDKQALIKMEEVAKKNRLVGYESNQKQLVFSLLRKYNYIIVSTAIGSLVFLFAALIYQRKSKRSPLPTAILMLIPMAILFFQINMSERTDQAIVSTNSTYLMSGPSAGSSVVSIINEGHLLNVLDKKDIWIHVKWMNQDVYLKEDQVLMVKL